MLSGEHCLGKGDNARHANHGNAGSIILPVRQMQKWQDSGSVMRLGKFYVVASAHDLPALLKKLRGAERE